MTVNAKQIAARLGISQSTVSRAFSPHASISPKMRDLVFKTALEFGYHPNAIARTLITRRSNIVGIVISNPTNPFYPEVLSEFSHQLRGVGLQSLLFNVPNSQDVEKELPSLLQYQVDAVVLVSSTISAEAAKLCAANGRLVVLFNLYVPNEEIAAVSCDNAEGGRQVATYIANAGYCRPAFVAGVDESSTSRDREQGFTDGLERYGLSLVGRTGENAFSYEAGRSSALSLAGSKPDVIFFANDLLAMGGMDALRYEANLRVPEDIAVIGFDDQPMASWASYNLTTIHRPVPQMVQKTVSLLSDSAKGIVVEPKLYFVPVELVERASSRRS